MSDGEDYGDSDYGYDSLDDVESQSSSDDDFDFGVLGAEEDTHVTEKPNYTVLSEAEILQRQEEAIDSVVAVLSVSKACAAILLRHFKWNLTTLHEHWFADEGEVRRATGLPPRELEEGTDPAGHLPMEEGAGRARTCKVCFEDVPQDQMRRAQCGHAYCVECWRGYLSSAVADGPCSLRFRCPHPECNVLVKDDLTFQLADADQSKKLKRFQLRSYVEDNPRVKWCPSPGVLLHLLLELQPGGAPPRGLRHRRQVGAEEQRGEREHELDPGQLQALPQVQAPEEKNQGCMHMTCSCRYEFCWLCLGPWSDHGERTGGFYACNRYDRGKQRGEYDEMQKQRDMAKHSLERYMHYYERWVAHEKSQTKALLDLRDTTDARLQQLSQCQSTPVSQLKFVTDAQAQIAECRRVLKWSYGYGYYADITEVQRNFFEFMQGDAEQSLETLTHIAEQDLARFLVPGPAVAPEGRRPPLPAPGSPFGPTAGTSAQFDAFRSKLTGLTAITKKFFQTLVSELEKGLPCTAGGEEALRCGAGHPSSLEPSSEAHGSADDAQHCGGAGVGSPPGGGAGAGPGTNAQQQQQLHGRGHAHHLPGGACGRSK
eukprot:CAMPEP_0114316268 /NCGR_PEP_ID=MMETSP0059-20121206/23095_1 /TAXON_ID=36894 /ORGANISM="Pyramimonas parkeae, Strain CCMP726" /LENGTH=598 /DNA_ID=CAMNT_0001442153 /DNA_START=352 /DNA_END=2148 /DNA_ORIENTATION=-